MSDRERKSTRPPILDRTNRADIGPLATLRSADTSQDVRDIAAMLNRNRLAAYRLPLAVVSSVALRYVVEALEAGEIEDRDLLDMLYRP